MLPVDKKSKPAKSHHAPTRTCVGCGHKDASGRFLRFVRTRSGCLGFDRFRRMGGRGAYLCVSKSCFEKALTKGLFHRALRGKVICDESSLLGELFGK